MNAETLERLLIDQALGQSGPDVSDLLAAYLGENPAAAEQARALQQTVKLASDTMRTGDAPRLPSFPTMRIRTLGRRRTTLRVVRDVGALAATLLLGVGLGAWRPAALVTHAEPLSEIKTATVISAPRRPAVGGDDFWSAGRLYQTACSAKPAGRVRLVWNSPIERPTLRGEL